MCGICGQYNFTHQKPVIRKNIERMAKTMAHRGPDDEGTYISGSLGLGFQRLSIIDLEGGHQPMSDHEGSVWVVFNGEIYNFHELKQELEQYGHIFRTKSDTEVIIHGYKQWGFDVLDHLNGMFGLAIWDDQRRHLMLARDRIGIKMLYYKVESGCLLFASEIRPILDFTSQRPEVNPVALNLFLRYRYTPSPLTLFKGINKLAPGTRLIIRNGDLPKLERWWNYKPVAFDPMPNPAEAVEELLALYKRAVQRQLISDVPLGLLLSGGVDSGLLLALMSQNGGTWKTFSVGYGTSYKDDELSYAARTADILHSPNVGVKLDRKTFEKSLPRIIACLEEPVAASSIVPMYHVCECASQHVKVALMGQGPDELFGGYTRHFGVCYGHYWRILPSWFQVLLSFSLSRLPRMEAVNRGFYSLGTAPRIKRYQQVFSILPGDTIDGLFKEDILPPHAGDKILECWEGLEGLMVNTDELGGLQFLEIRSSLPDELLVYADKLSMRHSLEVRVPYLDHEIVEYVEKLSASFKVRKGAQKWLHRNVCKKFLPKEIIQRKKVGFAANVVDDWFGKSLADEMGNTLLDKDSLMYDYLRRDRVQNLIYDHQSKRKDYHKILFSLIVYEIWLRSFCQK